MGPTSGYTIRPIAPADESFLWEALYHAIYVAPGDTPPERDIVNRPELARYVRGWGDANDLGFIAVAEKSQQPIGAAWIRLLTGENMGYGYTGDKSLRGKRQTLQLWLEQQGRCPICGEMLTEADEWDTHHIRPRVEGGKDRLDNLVLLHLKLGNISACQGGEVG